MDLPTLLIEVVPAGAVFLTIIYVLLKGGERTNLEVKDHDSRAKADEYAKFCGKGMNK